LGNDPRVTRAIVLQHTPTEGPERVATLLAARGIGYETRALHAGAPVPDDVAADQLLIVMGGRWASPTSATPRIRFSRPRSRSCAGCSRATRRSRHLPRLAAARRGGGRARLPEHASRSGRSAGPAREVGWGPVDLINVDGEPALAGLPAQPLVVHWHGDTYDLPPGAVHLASTPVCRHQAYRIGRARSACSFTRSSNAKPSRCGCARRRLRARRARPEGGARILADTDRHYAGARPIWDRLLGNIISVMQ
jgi:GMP synthase-like glutamine amidotransferase